MDNLSLLRRLILCIAPRDAVQQHTERKKHRVKRKNNNKRLLIRFLQIAFIYPFQKQSHFLELLRVHLLYRLVWQKRIPAINLGTRLVRFDRAAIEEMFPIRQTPIKSEKPLAKLYSLEPHDCYTIGEIAKTFGISESTVYKHIRKYSIPTRQIGNFVYAPKTEIESLYNQ